MPALSNFWQIVDKAIKDVGKSKIAVVVEIDVDNTLGVSTDTRQSLDHHPLVLKGAAGGLQNIQEDLFEEHLW